MSKETREHLAALLLPRNEQWVRDAQAKLNLTPEQILNRAVDLFRFELEKGVRQ